MIEQSGVIPYDDRDGLRLMLITSRRTGRWIVPKGHLEPGMSPAESAEAEAHEEAGVLGVADPEVVGVWVYRKRRRDYRVTLFTLRVARVLDDWLEIGQRERRWFSLKDALSVLDPPLARVVAEAFGEKKSQP